MPRYSHKHNATKAHPVCTECGRTAHVVTCVEPGCTAWCLSFSKWDDIELHHQGWTLRKDGTRHCPKHMPHWARQRRLAKKEGLAVDA
jgi:hypothetical protein